MMHAVSMQFLIEMCAFLGESLQVTSHLSSHECFALLFIRRRFLFCRLIIFAPSDTYPAYCM